VLPNGNFVVADPLQFTVTEAMTIGATFRHVDAPDPDLNVYLPIIGK